MWTDYEPLEVIAESARSRLLRARLRHNGQVMALKEHLGDDALAAWDRELEALKAGQASSHVVTLLGSSRPPQPPWIALEWLNGPSLDTLASNQPLSAAALIQLATHALEALQTLHRAGFLHRDVSPANLMLTHPGIWKLIDFDQARRLDEASMQAMTGTLHCMAPEQFDGTPLDERSDLYSLGCCLYFALTGRFFHPGETTAEVITSHLHPPMSDLALKRPDLPTDLIQALQKLLSRHPAGRPADCQQARSELESARIDSRS